MAALRGVTIRSFDWMLATAALLLVALGLTAIYSVDLSRGGELVYFRRQVIAAGLGVGLALGASLVHYNWFRAYAKHWYWLSVLLLGLVLLVGTTIRGTRGWFTLGTLSFQPVELGKFGLLVMVASVMAQAGRRFDRPPGFVGAGLLTLLVVGFTLLQPDLGSAILMVAWWFMMMLLRGVPRRYLATWLGGAILVGVVGWGVLLKPYQQDRLLVFLHPEQDPLGAGYTINQATIAVGAGRLLGRGLGFGSQSQLRFLPEAQSDFVFSVIAEELGLVGVTALLICWGILFWRLFAIARESSDDFVAAVVGGIILLFFCQLFINIGANLGLVPITGVTLPLVSYGGSSLLISLVLIGVAESMAATGRRLRGVAAEVPE